MFQMFEKKIFDVLIPLKVKIDIVDQRVKKIYDDLSLGINDKGRCEQNKKIENLEHKLPLKTVPVFEDFDRQLPSDSSLRKSLVIIILGVNHFY